MTSRQFLSSSRVSQRCCMAFALLCTCTFPALRSSGQEEKPAAKAPAEGAAAATEPKYLELVMDDRARRKGNTTIPGILRGSANYPLESNLQVFSDYYLKHVFARMTSVTNLSTVAKLRDEFFEDFDKCAKSPEITAHLNKLTSDMMFAIVYGPRRAVAQGGERIIMRVGTQYRGLDGRPVNIPPGTKFENDKDFHPAAKYNAILILGMLNSEAARAGKPAKPYSDVRLPLIQKIAEPPNVPIYLRVAALIGIARHIKEGPAAGVELDAGTQALTAAAMLKIVAEKPKLGQEAGYLWLQKQAVGILGTLHFLGNNGSVVEQLTGVIADSKRPLDLKFAVCDALGQLKLSAPPKNGAKQLVDQLAMLAVDACREEIYMASSPGQSVSRGRVVARVNSVMTGIYGSGDEGGGVGATDAALNGYVQRLHKKLTEVKKGFSTGQISETKLKTGADTIEAFISSADTADPADADADLLVEPNAKAPPKGPPAGKTNN